MTVRLGYRSAIVRENAALRVVGWVYIGAAGLLVAFLVLHGLGLV